MKRYFSFILIFGIFSASTAALADSGAESWYSKLYAFPFVRTSTSILLKVLLIMSIIWTVVWVYRKRYKVLNFFKRIDDFFNNLETAIIIYGLIALINLSVTLLFLLPSLLVGYFFDENFGVVLGVLTLVLTTVPMGITLGNIPFVKRFFRNDSEK